MAEPQRGRAAAVWAALRPPFLLLTPLVLLLGVSAAHAQAPVEAATAGLALGAALAAHAAVNLLNEWHDHRSGLDARIGAEGLRTRFSGGSGALPATPTDAPLVGGLGLAALALSALLGLMLVQALRQRDAAAATALAAIGLLGLGLVAAYTPWATRHPWAGLAAPGLGFGLAMVAGTELALAGRVSAAGAWAALHAGLMACGLLLLNQLPDAQADAASGRRTVASVHGHRRAVQIYAWMQAVAWLLPPLAVALQVWPPTALALWLTLPLGWWAAQRAARSQGRPGQLPPALALNVAQTLAAPTLLAWALAAG